MKGYTRKADFLTHVQGKDSEQTMAGAKKSSLTRSFPIVTSTRKLSGCGSINADLIHNWITRPINSLFPAPQADCRSLESGSHMEVVRIKQLLKNWKHPFSDKEFYLKLTNCT